jgi:hypothetical protein
MRSNHQHRATHSVYVIVSLIFLSIVTPKTVARSSDVTRCANNLKNIEIAKKIIAEERKLKPGDVIEPSWISKDFGDLRPCPSGGSYTIGAVETPATCSIANHTAAEAKRITDGWQREKSRDSAIALTVTGLIIAAVVILPIMAIRWYFGKIRQKHSNSK